MELLAGTPPQMMMADPNTGMRNAVAMAAARQLGQAQADPNWGMLGPEESKYMEDQLIDSVYNRLGGAAGSGPGKARAAKAIVEFRLSQMQKRADALAKLRGDLLGATSTPMATAPLQGQPGFLPQVAAGMAGSMAGGMGVNPFQKPQPRGTGYAAPAPGARPSQVQSSSIYDV